MCSPHPSLYSQHQHQWRADSPRVSLPGICMETPCNPKVFFTRSLLVHVSSKRTNKRSGQLRRAEAIDQS